MGVTITITLDPNGNVRIHAPMENKVLCYGLLELARDLVRDHQPAPAGGIEVARGPVPGRPPNGSRIQ